jgi:hypothetical protein
MQPLCHTPSAVSQIQWRALRTCSSARASASRSMDSSTLARSNLASGFFGSAPIATCREADAGEQLMLGSASVGRVQGWPQEPRAQAPSKSCSRSRAAQGLLSKDLSQHERCREAVCQAEADHEQNDIALHMGLKQGSRHGRGSGRGRAWRRSRASCRRSSLCSAMPW